MTSKKGKKGKKRYDVISVGSATIDCFVNLPGGFGKIRPGSKILIDSISLLTGGGGTNVAVGLKRLGMKVGYIGEVGDDHSAHIIRKELEEEGVDFLVKQHSRHETAYSVILEPKGKDRAILVYKGAASYLHREEVRDINKSADWFYFASVIGSSLKTMYSLANHAKKNRIKVFFNPSSYMIEKRKKEMEKLLSVATILSVNKEEAQKLVKSRSDDPKRLLEKMFSRASCICIITDGKRGAYVYDGENFIHRKARKVKTVDTTGAGDSFNAGFLAGYLQREDFSRKKRLERALRSGLYNAESVIRHVGAKEGLLTRRKMPG